MPSPPPPLNADDSNSSERKKEKKKRIRIVKQPKTREVEFSEYALEKLILARASLDEFIDYYSKRYRRFSRMESQVFHSNLVMMGDTLRALIESAQDNMLAVHKEQERQRKGIWFK